MLVFEAHLIFNTIIFIGFRSQQRQSDYSSYYLANVQVPETHSIPINHQLLSQKLELQNQCASVLSNINVILFAGCNAT